MYAWWIGKKEMKRTLFFYFFLLGRSGSNLELPGNRLIGLLARYRGRFLVTTGLPATSFYWSWGEGGVLYGQDVGRWVGGQQPAGWYLSVLVLVLVKQSHLPVHPPSRMNGKLPVAWITYAIGRGGISSTELRIA